MKTFSKSMDIHMINSKGPEYLKARVALQYGLTQSMKKENIWDWFMPKSQNQILKSLDAVNVQFKTDGDILKWKKTY